MAASDQAVQTVKPDSSPVSKSLSASEETRVDYREG